MGPQVSREENDNGGIHRLVPMLAIEAVGIRAKFRLRLFEFRRARGQVGKMARTLGNAVLGWLRERHSNGFAVVERNAVAPISDAHNCTGTCTLRTPAASNKFRGSTTTTARTRGSAWGLT